MIEKKLAEIRAQEKEKYMARVKELQEEFNQVKTHNQLKTDYENEKKKYLDRIVTEHETKLDLILS